MPDSYDVEVWRIEQTGKSLDGKKVLEVSLMVRHPSGQWGQTYTGEVYPQEVDLKSEPDDLGLRPDDLKELMASAAHEWDDALEEWGSQIQSQPGPKESDC